MTLTLNELINAQPALSEIIQKELPAVAAYRLSKLIKQISVHLESFENTRTEMIKRYGKEKEDGSFEIAADDKENKERFIEQMSSLLKETVSIEYQPVSITELANINITPITMIALEKFITEQ